MILSALPRFSGERYAQMFADRPEPATAIYMLLTREEAASPAMAPKLEEIKAACMTKPGMRYAGAFVITDATPDPDHPGAATVAFTFVRDERAPSGHSWAVEDATPATWSPDDAEHLAYADYLARFAGQDCCHFDLAWPLKPEAVRPALLAGFHNALRFKPGCRFVGSFVITDSAATRNRPEALHAAFVFVKD